MWWVGGGSGEARGMHVSQCGLEGGLVKKQRPEVPECSFNRAVWLQIFVCCCLAQLDIKDKH